MIKVSLKGGVVERDTDDDIEEIVILDWGVKIYYLNDTNVYIPWHRIEQVFEDLRSE